MSSTGSSVVCDGKEQECDILEYSIHSCSSYSGDFTPDRIQVNCPSDQKSRWLSDGSRIPQHITVKLAHVAIVVSVSFGKFEKSHACNLRKFSVYGGMDCDRMHLLCDGGLADNSEPETFPLRHKVEGKSFPCLYIKLVPLQSWGPMFAYSVWYMELHGFVEETYVAEAKQWLDQYYRRQALRLCMKHLRECDYTDAYLSLCKQSCVELEHPLLSQLHSDLVGHGDFLAAERIMQHAAQDGLLDSYVSQQPIQAKWMSITPTSEDRPGMRGGHQMCMDPDRETIYMFGGWDGTTDLCDLWQFSVSSLQWVCLSADTSIEGGPSSRSCHKMCLDVTSQRLYLLGRYLSPMSRSQMLEDSVEPHPLPGDFYSYSVQDHMWQLLSSDTHAHGGPHLLYDHQMVFDPVTHVIYVFGGRVLTSSSAIDSDNFTYSGLYSYSTSEHQWTCLRPDYCGGPYPYDLIPRMAHTLLLHPVARKLYVLGGQRNKQPLSDMITFDLQSAETEILANGKDSCIPAAGFTIRTCLDPVHNEIHLLTGLNKFDASSDRVVEKDTCSNSLWVYSIPHKNWTCIFTGNQGGWSAAHARVPAPRYAHQFIFDSTANCHYMFGGNLGNDPAPKPQASMRLDDFWRLKLVRQSKEELLRRCQLSIRRQQFRELVESSPVQALSFLQMSVSTLVNHHDEEESTEFRQLASTLFSSDVPHDQQDLTTRQTLFDQLSSYFPEEMAQPRDSILDMVKL